MDIIPADNLWGPAISNVAGGFAQGFTQRSDQLAIQKAIENLGEKPSGEDVMKAILNVNTYSPESKQKAFENFVTLEKLNETKQKAEALKAKQTEERNAIKGIVSQLDLPPEQKEQLGQSLDLKGATNLLTQQLKPKEEKLTPFEKAIETKAAEDYMKLVEDIPKLENNLVNLNYVQELSDQLGIQGTITSKVGLSKIGTEMENVAYPLLEPVIKIFNPSGTLAEKKLRDLRQQFHIKGSDWPWVRQGRIDAERRFIEQGIQRAKDKKAFLEKYNGRPPKELEQKFDEESEVLLDKIMDEDKVDLANMEKLGDPAKKKNVTRTAPNGSKYYSDGKTWKKI